MAMITCPECGKQVSELAEACPNCGFPMGFGGGKTGQNNNQQNQHQQNNTYQQNVEAQPIKAYVHEPEKNSGLGIAALIFSIFGVTFFIGIILAVIDLCRKDGRKKVLSVASLIVCAFWIILAISVGGGDSDDKKDEIRTESQNVTQDEEESFDESKQKKEEQKKKDFADSEEYTEVTSTELINSYNDNQVKCKQTYDGKMLKVSGKVQSVGTDIMGDTYVCLGHDTEFTFVGVQCYAKDDDTINQIAELKEGEEITVCGKGECGSLSFSLKDTQILDIQENFENSENEGLEEGEVEIVAEYTMADSVGWYTYHYIVIKNNADYTVDVSTSSIAYSESGEMVAADDASFDALGSGCTSVMYEAFETDKKIDHYETKMKYSESKHYESVIQDLSYSQNNVDDGAIFQVTNNGKDAADFVEGYALFFLNGELVYRDNAYFVDDESELKAGETISKQLTSYEKFDTIEFYLTGRKRK